MGSINYESIAYEGYGPGGVAVIVEALTDNRNRTASDVRHCFDKNGGSLGATGCVSWMFERKGVIVIENADSIDEEELIMAALEAGADDVDDDDGDLEITTSPAAFSAVYEALDKSGYAIAMAEVQQVPSNTVDVTEEIEESIQKMLDMLDDSDDVQNVYHNAALSDEE